MISLLRMRNIPTVQQEEDFRLFQEWKQEFKREYKTEEEEAYRFQNFKRTLRMIRKTNARRKNASDPGAGLNSMSDLSYEEFCRTRCGLIMYGFPRDAQPSSCTIS